MVRFFDLTKIAVMKALVILIFIVSPVSTVKAQQLEITPTAGWMFAGKLTTYYGTLNFRNNWNYGIILNYNIDRRLAIELMYLRLDTNVDALKGGITESFWPEFYEEYWQIGVMRTLQIKGKLKLFGGGTLGGTYFNPNHPEYGDDWRFSFTLGGGAKYYLSKRVGLRFDARLLLPVYWGGGSFYVGGGGGGVSLSTGSAVPQLILNGGLMIML